MLKTLSVLFSVGLLGISLACGASTSSSPGRDTPPDIASNGQAAVSILTSTPAPRSPSTDVEVGNKVGNRVPEFSIRLADGSTVGSASLVSTKKPVFLYFFATWCPTCRAELTRMRDVYPDYAEQVAFFLVGVDPSETLDQLEKTRGERNYPWPVAEPLDDMLRELLVVRESAKIAIDADGVIIYRRGGGGDAGSWVEVFSKLAESTES